VALRHLAIPNADPAGATLGDSARRGFGFSRGRPGSAGRCPRRSPVLIRKRLKVWERT
jgi:hypothetical protein